MNEVIRGIHVVKLHAWEDNFSQRIAEIREKELRALKGEGEPCTMLGCAIRGIVASQTLTIACFGISGRKYLDALCVFFWATTPVLISIITFATYSLIGNELTAATVFTSVALFNMLIGPLNAFPWVLNGLVEVSHESYALFDVGATTCLEAAARTAGRQAHHCIVLLCFARPPVASLPQAWVSIKRIDEYLSVTDVEPRALPHELPGGDSGLPEITAQAASFSWAGPDEAVLRNIDFSLGRRELVCVTGKVGTGKSSLLLGLLGEMNTVSGTVTLNPALSDVSRRGIGFVAQEPFIQNATIRDNILFGTSMDEDYYQSVLAACALDRDIAQLSGGDMTEIGENGTNLSGGQKARLCLARSAYQRCAVYLLDDPLAALDAKVAAHVLVECICGLMGSSARVLCTHNKEAVSRADRVFLAADGTIQPLCQGGVEAEVFSAQPGAGLGSSSNDGGNDKGRDTVDESGVEVPEGALHGLTDEEERDVGVVALTVYRRYWHAVGTTLAVCVLLSMLLMQASRNLSDWWLSFWISHSGNASSAPGKAMAHMAGGHALVSDVEETASLFLGIYGAISAGNALFTLARSFLFAYAGVRAARIMQQDMLKGVMGATLRFFQTTPIGRLVNRFSSDVYGVDDSLPFIANIFFAQSFGFLGSIVVSCYGLPYFAIALVPLGLLYYYVQKYYRQTSREVKRLGSISRSPMYAHFTETLAGVATVRAHRCGARFLQENVDRLHGNQVAVYTEQSVSQWLSIRLQLIAVIMVTCVSFIAAAEHHLSHVDAGLVGLAVSYALSITGLLQGIVTSFTETEKEMVAVERMQQYALAPQEPSEELPPGPPFPSWPRQGHVVFDNVVLRYAPGAPNSLDGVTLSIAHGDKVGVVGRTGAGKSSLFQVCSVSTEASG